MEKAIFSAAIAILLFALSQLFIHMRDRQTFLRQKLEELFDAMNNLSEIIGDTYYGAQKYEQNGNFEEISGKIIEINKALYKPRTLVLLYFPYMKTPWEELIVTHVRQYVDYFNKHNESNKNFKAAECYKNIQTLSLKIRSLQNFLSANIAFTTQSIGFHIKSLFTRKMKINIKT
ncbi:hypothetical protein SAMN05660860_00888 [Geoalkalibacter ferrihydriticus]|uniref:Uncharacterized protein n=2 Tax=Geoalkalibacter ferrihydriticus TaxID=392333 RepID=A0A0C2EDT7_9BACT|nr:hypothetical protein [Geoalkalibacter ferrihydriticus]KIH76738.1 hypothetical protein GFER_06265 [Geoalkalibacter ferrihydriticus DSM 17813]SDL54409.1 hypothetical protein SAMN05660860_00888 [Geoalkalibacter ferrihydriticus]